MKRSVVLLVLLLFLFLSPLNAMADDTSTYVLDNIGLSVGIPNDMLVLTRETPSGAPQLDALGLDRDTMLQKFQADAIHLSALPRDLSYEIIIMRPDTQIASKIGDFNQYADDDLIRSIEDIITYLNSDDYIYESITVHDHHQVKYVRSSFTLTEYGELAYGIQYMTVYDDSDFFITLYSYSGEITESMEQTIQQIIASTQYHNVSTMTELDSRLSQHRMRSRANAFLLMLGITIVLNMFPVILYLNILKKKPLSPRQSIRFALINCIIAFLLAYGLGYILGSTIASYISIIFILYNYRRLKTNYRPDGVHEPINPLKVTAQFWVCPKCKEDVPMESYECQTCGYQAK